MGNPLTLQVKNDDEIALPGFLAASLLSLDEIGAIACLACMDADPEGTGLRMQTPEMTAVIGRLHEKGIFKIEASEPGRVNLTIDFDLVSP